MKIAAFIAKKDVKAALKAWPVMFFAAGGICFATSKTAQFFGCDLRDQASLDIFKNAHGWRLVLFCLYAVIGAPVAEECIFRALLFRLPTVSLGKKLAVKAVPGLEKTLLAAFAAVSSVLFTAMHYGKVNPFPDNAFLALFFIGVFQCMLYTRTGRLSVVIINHILFNLTNLVALAVFGL